VNFTKICPCFGFADVTKCWYTKFWKFESSANYWGCCSRPHKNSSATHFGVATHGLGTTVIDEAVINESKCTEQIYKVSNPIRIVLKKLVSEHQGKLFVFRANCYFRGNFSDPLSKMPSRTPMTGRWYTAWRQVLHRSKVLSQHPQLTTK